MAGVGGLSFFPSKSFSKYLPQKTIRARYAKRISAATCRILRTGRSIGLFKEKTSIYRKKTIKYGDLNLKFRASNGGANIDIKRDLKLFGFL